MRHASFACLLLAAALVSGCATSPRKPLGDDPAHLQAQAEQAMRGGDYSTAGRTYREWLDQAPKEPAAWRGLGESLLALGEAKGAFDAFSEGLKVAPDDVDALEGRGLALIGLQRQDEAESDLMKVLGHFPDRWRALDGMGLVSDLRGKSDTARGWYQAALNVRNDEPTLYNNYGYSRMMARDFPAAEQLFRQGLKLEPGMIRLRNNLLLAISWQGDYERAVEARGDIPLHVALNNVGYIALLRKDYDVSARLFQRAIDASPGWYERAAANLETARRKLVGGD